MRNVLLIICAVCLLIAGCGKGDYRRISQDEAQAIIQFNPQAIILDVRTQEEYWRKHIQNAVLLPIEDLRAGEFSKLSDKKATILIYCRTGRLAVEAAEILSKNGYENVFEMGGIVNWSGSVAGTDIE